MAVSRVHGGGQVGMDQRRRADAPIAKVDFVNLEFNPATPGAASPQPLNHALVELGAIALDGSLIVNSRELVDDTLKNPSLFSSADLVEQGNTLPLIPLNIDPPDHLKYERRPRWAVRSWKPDTTSWLTSARPTLTPQSSPIRSRCGSIDP